MERTLNIFGKARLTRPNFETVNPALAEVLRLEMFGAAVVSGASTVSASQATSTAEGALVFSGSSNLSATSAQSSAFGTLELFVDEAVRIPGGGYVSAPKKPRVIGKGLSVARSVRSSGVGRAQVMRNGSGIASHARGTSAATGFVFNTNGRASLRSSKTISKANGYAARGRSELELLAMIFDAD